MTDIEAEIADWVESGENRRVEVEEDGILQIKVVRAIDGYRVGQAAYSKQALEHARHPSDLQMAVLKQAIAQVDPTWTKGIA